MTPNEQAVLDAARAKQQEAEDLADIAELKRTVGFERYWMRHLRLKIKKLATALKDDPMTHEEREITRQKLLFAEELEKMMRVHEGSIKSKA